jgi:hypothetical protein
MKNKRIVVITLFIATLTMSFVIKFSTAGFGDSTGAPLKGVVVSQYKGCNSTGCHTGKPFNDFTAGFVDVISDIPLTGWVPNATYNLTVTAVSPNKFAYGFQLTAWGKTDSVTKGTLIASNTDVQIRKSILKNSMGVKLDSNYYATHKQTSVAHGSANNKWTMQWTAPSVKNQQVRLFLTVVCANANGGISGDYVYRINKNADSSSIANLNVNAVGINEYTNTENVLVFPSITSGIVNISIPNNTEQATIYVMDITGKIVLKQSVTSNTPTNTINLADFETGNYVITIQSANYNFSKKIIKL